MVTLIISLIGITLAIASFAISVHNFRKDRPKIKFSYDIMCNNDRSKQWIRIFYINVRRRPTLIKSIGYYDWTLGCYLSKGGDKFENVLKEGDFGTYDIEIFDKDQWRIKTFYVEDHFNNRWELKESQMWFLHSSAHKSDSNLPKIAKSFKEQQTESMNNYLKFIERKKYKNNSELVKKFIETGKIYD